MVQIVVVVLIVHVLASASRPFFTIQSIPDQEVRTGSFHLAVQTPKVRDMQYNSVGH